MKIERYLSNHKEIWDSFVLRAKNSHFFFFRDYMEYHSDRFNDASLLVFNDKGNVTALLPANVQGDTLYSHQGLTFGGFLIDDRMKTETMLDIFKCLIATMKEDKINKIIYKCIPYIYHVNPSEEDRYALFRVNANLKRRDVTSTINLRQEVRYSKGRKWIVNKAKKYNLNISETTNYDAFWEILTSVLEKRHEAEPVHNVCEIKSLAERFPQFIKLFIVEENGNILAGVVVYENKNISHTQYMATSDYGKEIGALDFLLDHLIKNVYRNKIFFDFGISNEDDGWYLNTGLISQKEGFGARAIVQDIYEIEVI